MLQSCTNSSYWNDDYSTYFFVFRRRLKGGIYSSYLRKVRYFFVAKNARQKIDYPELTEYIEFEFNSSLICQKFNVKVKIVRDRRQIPLQISSKFQRIN